MESKKSYEIPEEYKAINEALITLVQDKEVLEHADKIGEPFVLFERDESYPHPGKDEVYVNRGGHLSVRFVTYGHTYELKDFLGKPTLVCTETDESFSNKVGKPINYNELGYPLIFKNLTPEIIEERKNAWLKKRS